MGLGLRVYDFCFFLGWFGGGGGGGGVLGLVPLGARDSVHWDVT